MPLSSLDLMEHKIRQFEKSNVPEIAADTLWRSFSSQVRVEWPTPKTNDCWELTNQGWVGHIPLPDGLVANLLPKISLQNLFGMYEYAYRLKSFRFLDGMSHADTLRERYEQLALVLSKRVLDRARQGYYRAYIGEQDQLPYLRGRLDLAQSSRTPWQVDMHCHFEDHTADVEENQLLAWTLRAILRTGLCGDRVQPAVIRAYRSVQGVAALQPFSPQDCTGRLYNRLNLDYQPLHALCRFFLDQAGPSHVTGERHMVPFIVDMARLFELFVAECLTQHMGYPWRISPQKKVSVGDSDSLHWNVNIVIENEISRETLLVLDTKYKDKERPLSDDIAQVVAYAEATGCHDAVLVYPARIHRPLDEIVGDIRVRSIAFDLMGDLEEAGEDFLRTLDIARILEKADHVN